MLRLFACMSNHDIPRAGTVASAEALGLSMDVGSLKAAKLADLVVLDRNPLENRRNTNSVAMVMKDGPSR